jgi:hypothetical protein
MSYEQIGEQFVDFYYKTFDSGRAGLAPVYVSFRHQPLDRNDASQTRAEELVEKNVYCCSNRKTIHNLYQFIL